MMKRILLLVLLTSPVPIATATNVIREWGNHAPSDFIIQTDMQGNARNVTILADANPSAPWRFEAFDSVSGEPGYIDYIRIADGVLLGNLHMSVAGDTSAGHLHGAAQLRSIDLVTNGDGTNTIDEIDITGNFGELGPMLADYIGTLTVGGNVLNDVSIVQNVSGPIAITGDLTGDLNAGTINSPVAIGGVLAGTVIAGTLAADLAVTGAGPHTGGIDINSFDAPYAISIAGDFENGTLYFGM